MCPYMAGGRSRRGSPKAGTTVSGKLEMRINEASECIEPEPLLIN